MIVPQSEPEAVPAEIGGWHGPGRIAPDVRNPHKALSAAHEVTATEDG